MESCKAGPKFARMVIIPYLAWYRRSDFRCRASAMGFFASSGELVMHRSKAHSRFDAVVLVFEADDVIFAEVAPRLHFNDFQGDDPRVFQAVLYP